MSRSVATVSAGLAIFAGIGTELVAGLDNGLGKTPPMGFNPWNVFGITAGGSCKLVNPKLPPPGCHGFNESIILDIAHALVNTGLASAGYTSVNLDCGWTTGFRNDSGGLITNTTVFPHGMKWLGDQLHDLGLQFGIYADAGKQQCCSRIHQNANDGSLGHEKDDALLFAEFGVDYLKYDSCGEENSSYPTMRDALNATGRPIYYSIHGPHGTDAAPLANTWRTTPDIDNTFVSMLQRAVANDAYQPVARPGAFNNPDMLEVGNFYTPLGVAESRTQMSLWCVMKAPLLIGTDLTTADRDILEILGNKEAIAINQDKLGLQAKLVTRASWVADSKKPPLPPIPQGPLLWAGPLDGGDFVVAVVNQDNETTSVTVDLSALIPMPTAFDIRNVWEQTNQTKVAGNITYDVGPHDTTLLRVTPL